ncbi:MAG: thermonuclease family protein [Planctomycetota bacterium]
MGRSTGHNLRHGTPCPQRLRGDSLAAPSFSAAASPGPAALASPQDRSGGSDRPVQAPPIEVLRDCQVDKPTELFSVLWVVDGDTIHIERGGKREKLRLLSIDTEEKYNKGNVSETKPYTRFGEQATGWAQGFLMPRSPEDGQVMVGLRFPGGVEAYDIYGRLLCHVVTAEGIDFNLLMVRTGLSPYFNKYGNSRIDHTRFVELAAKAKSERRGIWDQRTNEGGKRRPYGRLIPWWQARADAIDAHRVKASEAPLRYVAADDPDALEASLANGPERVTVLALVDRFFEEDDGSRTVLLRSGDKRRSLRVSIPKDQREAMARHDLDHAKEDFRQNYFLIDGTLKRGKRGFDLTGVGVDDWRLAGPGPR